MRELQLITLVSEVLSDEDEQRRTATWKKLFITMEGSRENRTIDVATKWMEMCWEMSVAGFLNPSSWRRLAWREP